MQPILLVLQVLVGIALIVLVLLQQGRGADAGASFGGGGAGSLFGARGPASFLAKATGMLAAVFFINSLSLAYLATLSVERRSVTERVEFGVPQGGDSTVPMAPESSAGAGAEQSGTGMTNDAAPPVAPEAAPSGPASGTGVPVAPAPPSDVPAQQ